MRLLLIRPGALGDTLLTFPVIEALRAYSLNLHNPHVILVGNKAVLPLAQAFGLVEEAFDYEEPLWSGLFAAPHLCTSGTDSSCSWNHLANHTIKSSEYSIRKEHNPSLHAILSGIDRAVAWLSDPDHIVFQNVRAAGIPQVTVVPGHPSAQEHMHVVDYLARSVGVSTNPHPHYGDNFSVSGDVPAQGRAFAIHPGSGGARKCWPPQHFAAVIRRLWQWGWPILLLCGPADHERLEVLLKLLPTPPRPAMLKLLVDMPLLDLVPMLRQCRGYLGNDSGMTHLAALLGLPTLALFGPSDPLIWQPRGRVVSIIHEPDLEKLGVERVLGLIRCDCSAHRYH